MIKIKQHVDSFEEECPVEVWRDQSVIPVDFCEPLHHHVHGSIHAGSVVSRSLAENYANKFTDETTICNEGYSRCLQTVRKSLYRAFFELCDQRVTNWLVAWDITPLNLVDCVTCPLYVLNPCFYYEEECDAPLFEPILPFLVALITLDVFVYCVCLVLLVFGDQIVKLTIPVIHWKLTLRIKQVLLRVLNLLMADQLEELLSNPRNMEKAERYRKFYKFLFVKFISHAPHVQALNRES